MDYLGGGPPGITELLFRADPVPTYLNHDWFRDCSSLQRLVQFYPTRNRRDSTWAPRCAAGW